MRFLKTVLFALLSSVAAIEATNTGPLWAFDACGSGKKIALTFNDGPIITGSATSSLLSTMSTLGLKGSFYLSPYNYDTDQMSSKTALVNQMISAGHFIGNGGWDATDMSALTNAQLDSQQLAPFNDWYYAIAKKNSTHFRPYAGAMTLVQAEYLTTKGIVTGLWGFDSEDWNTPNDFTSIWNTLTSQINSYYSSYGAYPGSMVIVMSDENIYNAVDSTGTHILKQLQQTYGPGTSYGYSFVTADDCFNNCNTMYNNGVCRDPNQVDWVMDGWGLTWTADSTSAPASTTATPAATTKAPSLTTASPAYTTTPAGTTKSPASTTAAPASTTATPVATTKAPASTTATPAATTPAAPTAIPTATPTSISTKTPTLTPTKTPTSTPTFTPTKTATTTPTFTPSKTPTAHPTSTPTKTPTLAPTSIPTRIPTASPTVTPTSSTHSSLTGPIYGVEACGSGKKIAMTFDDGPVVGSGQTATVLDNLDALGIKATFFMSPYDYDTEQMASKGPLVQRMISSGHSVGCHTWTHTDITTLTNSQIVSQQLAVFNDWLYYWTGKNATFFRPPYGSETYADAVFLTSLGHVSVGWGLDSEDWESADEAASFSNIESYFSTYHSAYGTYPDSVVILMHDYYEGAPSTSTPNMYDTSGNPMIQDIYDTYGPSSSYGYSFVTMDQCWSECDNIVSGGICKDKYETSWVTCQWMSGLGASWSGC